MRHSCLSFILWLLLPGLTQAATGASFLTLPVSARSLGMGEAFTAVANDVNALDLNPGGLAFQVSHETVFTHKVWIQDIFSEHLAYGQVLKEFQGFGAGAGASLDFTNYGSFPRFTLDSGGMPVRQGDFGVTAWNAGLGAGLSYGWLGFGITGRYLRQDVDLNVSETGAADFGLLLRPPEGIGPSFGLALQNKGWALGSAELPLALKTGLAYSFTVGVPYQRQDLATLAVDLHRPLRQPEDETLNLGLEYVLRGTVSLRLGHKSSPRRANPAADGVTAGLGLRRTWLGVDYGYSSLGASGSANLISLSAVF